MVKKDETERNLIVIHSLNEAKLFKTLKLGGIPMPSIAITKVELGTSSFTFGDISLVFGEETINPANKRNKVYRADVWTPTFPRIEYEADGKVALRIEKQLEGLAEKKGLAPELKKKILWFSTALAANLDNYGGYEGIVEHALNNDGMKAAYLASQGKVVPQMEKPAPWVFVAQKAMAKRMVEVFGSDIDIMRKLPLNQVFDEYGSQIIAVVNEFREKKINGVNLNHSKVTQKIVTSLRQSHRGLYPLTKLRRC